MTKDLHEPALTKMANTTSQSLIKAVRSLAISAAESNAATASMTLSWISDDEIVDARYVPELTLRVKEVH